MRVQLEAVRYLDEPQPGVIEAYLTAADGFRWQIVEKTVMFHEYRELTREVALPMPVSIECRISADNKGPTVWITLPNVGDRPYEVSRDQLIDG